MKALRTIMDHEESKDGAQVKMEAQFNSDSTTLATRAGFIRIVTQSANRLRFQ
jgi:hypothetical protein